MVLRKALSLRRVFVLLVVGVLGCVCFYNWTLQYTVLGATRQGELHVVAGRLAQDVRILELMSAPPASVNVTRPPGPLPVTLHQDATVVTNRTPTAARALVIPTFQAIHANCANLFAGDAEELRKTILYQRKRLENPLPNDWFANLAQNCEQYRRKRGYATQPLTEEEAEVPIAFSILFYKNVEQFERLLRVIYRPQNYYCVHVDAKAQWYVKEAATAITGCFPNVFMASTSVKVRWGRYSVLKPELVCMADLWKYDGWKYFINLTGQEFPLQTMLDIVKILKIYNGANDIWGTVKKDFRLRTKFVFEGMHNTYVRKSPAPGKVTLHKGSVHIIACRGFVDYVLHDQIAVAFSDWVNDTMIPDETFFSTLQFNPHLGIPGSFNGSRDEDGEPHVSETKTRFKIWEPMPCKGIYKRHICIPGVGDLPKLYRRPELFMNKIHLNYHPLVLDCMEELILNRTRDQLVGISNFNASIYENMYIVKHHF